MRHAPGSRVATVLLVLLLIPAPAQGAPGICSATTDGSLGEVLWTGSFCRDLLDSCAGCPDSDDIVNVNGRSIVVEGDATVDRLQNSVPQGAVLVKAGATLRIEDPSGAGGDEWTCPSCLFQVEPGAAVEANSGDYGVTGVQHGRVIIEGSEILRGKILGAIPRSATRIEVSLEPSAAGVSPGDLLRIETGLARGFTFEVVELPAGNPRGLILDVGRRDPLHDYTLRTGFVESDKRYFRQTSGTDAVTKDDEGYLGKFLWETGPGGAFHPIVAVDEGGGSGDRFECFYDLPDGATAMRLAYGFEEGGDRAVVYRPARIAAAGGNRFYMQFADGSRSTLRYADFMGIGLQVGDVDNAARPLEYFDLSDTSIHEVSDLTALQLAPSGSAAGAKNNTLDRIEIFMIGSSPGVNLSGRNLVLRNSLIRDSSASVAAGVSINGDGTGRISVEDVSILRLPQALIVGDASARPDATIRGLWAVGRGRRSAPGAAGVIWNGSLIDPFDFSPGKDDGRQRMFGSVLYSHSNAEIGTPGRSIGHRLPTVNSVLAYSGLGRAPAVDNSDGMYRGDAWYTLLTRNARHGQSECTWCVALITSLNNLYGLASAPEACTLGTCTPTPFPRRMRGNLSFGNGRGALFQQDFNQPAEVTHNTLVNPAGSQPVAVFNPVDPFTHPACLDSSSPSTCGPDTGNGTARPPWWTPPPPDQPDTTLTDSIIGAAPPGLFALGHGGTRFAPADLLHTYNYYFEAEDPDLGVFAPPASGEMDNQPDPFVDTASHDFRLAAPLPGSDGRNMGAGHAGLLVDPAAMPAVYETLLEGGVLATLRNGDLESVDGDLDGKAEFVDFEMTGARVTFTFAATPDCPAPEDCADLLMDAIPADGSPVIQRAVRVPVQGGGAAYSVSESAIPLVWSGIEVPAQVRVRLRVGETLSPAACWDFGAAPYAIPEYAVPKPGATDADGDTVEDACDNCPGLANPSQGDNDADRSGDACDEDDDDDGVSDAADNCPFEFNPGQADIDTDGAGDACDADLDGDGLIRSVDNCVLTANGGQEDFDGDGFGDACDDDDDDDGLLDVHETNTGSYVSPTDTGSDPFNADSDGDGFGDGAEVAAGTDPNNPGSFPGAIFPALSGPGVVLFLLLAGLVFRRMRRR